MSGALGRTSAVLRADLRVRLRRPSTAVLLLAAALGATLLVPDPRSGRALLKVDGARALMTSETTSFATAAQTCSRYSRSVTDSPLAFSTCE